MDAFDADVLIYAAEPGHRLGEPIRNLFAATRSLPGRPTAGIGSVVLVPELLPKPRRLRNDAEAAELVSMLERLDLIPVDWATANLAASVGARYGLRALDAIHLDPAIVGGADRFITNNSKDFAGAITEIAIVTPADIS